MSAVSQIADEMVAIGTTPERTSASSWISLCGYAGWPLRVSSPVALTSSTNESMAMPYGCCWVVT
jgi:hypothetical protein